MYRIACPKCSKTLKFKDASRVGSKAKCPKCGHSFVVELPEAPDEVELHLAEPPATAPPPPEKQPLVGTSAKWVPDEPNPTVPQTSAPLPAAVEPIPNQFDFAEPATSPIVTPAEETSTVRAMQQRKQRRGKGGLLLTIGGFLVTASVAAAAFFWKTDDSPEPEQQQVVANEAWQAEKDNLQSAAKAAKELSPTSGEPIELKGLIGGANIVVHLHPSEIWSSDDSRREFVFALGPLATWLEAQIRELTSFEPSEIDQLTIAIGLDPRESEPEVSALVQLHEEQQLSLIHISEPTRPY